MGLYESVLKAMANRIIELQEKLEWQPIETAPKDGSQVLVIERGVRHVAWYHESSWTICGDACNYYADPDLWMPLEPIPKEEA